jgi:hypothetical protein
MGIVCIEKCRCEIQEQKEVPYGLFNRLKPNLI